MTSKALAIALTLLAIPHLTRGAGPLVGGETVYEVREGDTLARIGGFLGADWVTIARDNNLDWRKPIRPGQKIRITTLRIVPRRREDGIVINIPENMLYVFKRGRIDAFPVGLGMPRCDRTACWRTPVGPFTVTWREKDPTWHVPESMQEEMEREGEEVLTVVPPGPENPLGRFAVHLSIPGILIHETIWPETVYQYRSHGCIRMHREHMEPFFEEVERGTPGEIIYEPVKAAAAENGRVYLEVHRDVYRTGVDPGAEARARIENLGLSGQVDWGKVAEVVNRKSGRAEGVTR